MPQPSQESRDGRLLERRDWRTMSRGSADALSVIMAYNEIIGDNLPVDLVCRNRRSQLNRVSG